MKVGKVGEQVEVRKMEVVSVPDIGHDQLTLGEFHVTLALSLGGDGDKCSVSKGSMVGS